MVVGITAALHIENKLLNAVIVVVMVMPIAPTPIHVRCFSSPIAIDTYNGTHRGFLLDEQVPGSGA